MLDDSDSSGILTGGEQNHLRNCCVLVVSSQRCGKQLYELKLVDVDQTHPYAVPSLISVLLILAD